MLNALWRSRFPVFWHCFIKMCEASLKKGVPRLNLSPSILFRKRQPNKSNGEFKLNTEAVTECFFPHRIFFLVFFIPGSRGLLAKTGVCVFTPYNPLSDTKIYNLHI